MLSMWAFPLKLVWKRQQVQNAVASLICEAGKFSHIFLILAHLHCLPVSFHAKFNVLALMYKTLSGLGPCYLLEHLFQRTATQPPLPPVPPQPLFLE